MSFNITASRKIARQHSSPHYFPQTKSTAGPTSLSSAYCSRTYFHIISPVTTTLIPPRHSGHGVNTTTPSPRHSGHGVNTTTPSPRHSGHGIKTATHSSRHSGHGTNTSNPPNLSKTACTDWLHTSGLHKTNTLLYPTPQQNNFTSL